MPQVVRVTSRRALLALSAVAFAATFAAAGSAVAADPATSFTTTIQEAADPLPPGATRWDVTIHHGDHVYPAWFELAKADASSLMPSMRFQGAAGGPEFGMVESYADNELRCRVSSLGVMSGRFEGDRFAGVVHRDGDSLTIEAVRAPELPETSAVWASPKQLFDGRSTDGWTCRWGRTASWSAHDGVLESMDQTDDLVSIEHFMNFKLHLQYRLQRHQDSGVQLRGRYEIQFKDKPDAAGPRGKTGAVYGYVAPARDAEKPAGSWNTLEIELVGRMLTVRLNGNLVQDHTRLLSITGDALDSKEGEPGPVMLQGHLGAVEFRDIVITPERTPQH